MKSILAIAMAALMVLSFVSVASAADTVEIRSPVFTGPNTNALVPGQTTDYTDFAAFWYDIDEGLGSEEFTIVADPTADNTIDEGYLEYTATVRNVDYTYAPWSAAPVDEDDRTFQKLGFFAEEYVPVNGDLQILSTLIMDDDEKYTMRVGQTLDLGEGFALTPKQIDVDGQKVWLELTKDGEFLDDDVYNTEFNTDESSWDYDADVAGEEDVVIMRVHVNEVFQGQVDSLAIVEGIWLMSDEAMEIEDDDEFGKMEVIGADDTTITLKSTEDITLGKDDTIDLTDGIKIQVADDDALRFYFYKEITEPGTYEVRGTVATPDGVNAGNQTWTPAEFAGFFYDIDDDIQYESLTINWQADGRTVLEDTGVSYTATMDTEVPYEYAGWADSDEVYTKMAFLAKEYVPVNDDPQILSTLILDDDEKYTMRVGQTLDLGEGFALTPKQIDVDGQKVWLELTKDGEFLDDDVYNTEFNTDNSSWDYDADIAGEEDVIVLRVHVNEVFQGQVDSLAIIEGIWLMSDEAMEIEDDDEFGALTVEAVTTTSITLENTDEEINLNADDTIDLTDDIKIQVADDNDNVRFYPFVEMTVDGEAPEVEEVEEPVEEVEEPVDENVTEPVDENVTEPVDEVEEPVEEEEEEPVPGFEAVFAIAGLLAVAYFVRRN